MCFDTGEYVEFSESCVRKARKPHQCDECYQTINRGEHYRYESGKFEGSFYTSYLCRTCCYEIARIVAHELDEGCRWYEAWPPLGEVRDYLSDTEMGHTKPEDVPEWFDLPAVYPHKAIERLREKAA